MRSLGALWVVAWALLSVPWESSSATPHWHRVGMPRLGARRLHLDHVANVAFYLPIAPLGVGVGMSLPAAIAAGAGFSSAAEASQLFSTIRHPDANDVILNVGGTVTGATLFAFLRSRRRRHLAPEPPA